MFNTGLYKSNKKYILAGILLVLLFVFINFGVNQLMKSDRSTQSDALFRLNDKAVTTNKLVINELMSSNKGAYVDEDGNACDWIELYNGLSHDVNLKNYGLSDEDSGRVKWVFPDVTIKSKEHLIVFLSKEIDGDLHANFSLKQEGEELVTLKKANGKVVDSVKTVKLNKNTTMARDNTGKWVVTEEITPGYENSIQGREGFLSNLGNSDIKYPVALTEFLPSNEGNIVFDNHKLYGYVEVKNESNETINLHDYYLSNDENVLYKWRFPDTRLKAGESYLVYTNSLDKDNNASFNLKHRVGNVILSTYTGVVEDVSYEELKNGVAYIKEDGKWTQGISISPGFDNTNEGKTKFYENMDQPKNDLVISEVMSSNNSYLPQNGNQYYDWIELYNNSTEAINLKEYQLSLDYDDNKMYTLPERVLLPGSYYVIMASGNVGLSNASYDHANFKLSSGTGLFLYKDEELMDSLYVYNIPKGYSYGRGQTGHYYFATPTPGTINTSVGLRMVSTSPIVSVPGGVYNNMTSLSVEFKNSTDVYYTLDGTDPTYQSIPYEGPIVLTATTVLKAVTYVNGVKSEVVTNSYILNENHSLPVMSVSLDPNAFNRVQANINGNVVALAHAELYERKNSFSIDCDLKLFGSASKTLPKKSFSLKFSYGHLLYKVFDDKELVEFNSLVLRSGSQDQRNSMMKDEFLTTLAIKYGTLDAQATKPVVLYINGQYWGVYYIREKVNNDFIENNYNVQTGTNIANYYYQAEEGSNADIMKVKRFINSHNMSDANNYEYVSTILDIDNFIDLWVFQYFTENTDIHNIRYYNNPSIANGKVRMILFDLDYSMFVHYGTYYFDYIQNPSSLQDFLDTSILVGLMKNDTFKKRFVQRISYNLKNVWTMEHINQEWEDLYGEISLDMVRNCERWNYNYNNWINNAGYLRTYALNRIDEIKNETKTYFNLSQEEFNEYFG